MKAWMMHSGYAYVLTTAKPLVRPVTIGEGRDARTVQEGTEEVKEWEKDDQKALGSIQLRLSTTTLAQIETKATAKEAWDELKKLYGTPNASSIITDFRAALNSQISPNQHPRAIIDSMAMNFKRIADTSDKLAIPASTQVLILILKLPDSYKTIIDSIAMATLDELKELDWEGMAERIVTT
jgi:hypothetical protein